MLLKSFYRSLARASQKVSFYVRKDGCIRARIGNCRYCPITAVEKINFGHDMDVIDAGLTDILSEDDSQKVIEAADLENDCDQRVRKALLRNVGLSS